MDPTIPVIALIIVVVVAVAVAFGRRSRTEAVAETRHLGETAERLASNQAELSGRLQQYQSGVNERLDALSKRLGDGLAQQTEKTGETLKVLHERLAVIDTAQRNITDLSQQMVGLQEILSNKQARGAFGEIQLRDLVTTILPPSAYVFQATLSNRSRVDCLLALPNPPGSIAIDAKFPLEGYNALHEAEGELARAQAARAFAASVIQHVRDIAEKYIIPGETAESALMFLPSEAIYAELHANFRPVVEESFRRRVWIVSPTTLMATLNTVRAVLKDAQMREQAGIIQAEVAKLLEDVARLDKRVDSLQTHFDLASRDIRNIRISADKVTKRGENIDTLQLEEGASSEELEPPHKRAERG